MTQPTPQPRNTPPANRDIVVGATVYGVDNARFGQVAGSYRNYLIVERGFFMPIDYYVPMNAIGRVDDDLVVLSLSRDAALSQGWERPPFTSETGQRGLRRPAVGRAGGVAPAAGAATQRPQPTAQSIPGGGWSAPSVSDVAAGTGPAAKGRPSEAPSAGQPAGEGEPPTASPAASTAATSPAAAPSTGVFADTYAVGTNTDSYQAMTDFRPSVEPAPPARDPAAREPVAPVAATPDGGAEPPAPDPANADSLSAEADGPTDRPSS